MNKDEIGVSKKKILILVDWFAPGYKAGGPIQSCVNVSFALKDSYNIFVFTTDTDFGSDRPYEGIIPNSWSNTLDPLISVFYADKNQLSRKLVRRVIAETDADFIYLNHLFSPLFVVYPLWLKWRGMISSKIVICPRGALYSSALAIKKFKKYPFLKLFKWLGIHKLVRFHATNQRENDAIIQYFPASEVIIADNLPNSKQGEFKDLVKNTGDLNCIFISRLHPIKNLKYLLVLLQKVKASVSLTIIGPEEDINYWNECKSIITKLPINIKVHYQGAVPNHELSEFICANHLFILPTTGENFGHAIFESFLAGRPVLISDQTPWRNLQEHGVGWDISLNDDFGFVKAIEVAASWTQPEFSNYARSAWMYAKQFIENKTLKQQYFQLFHDQEKS